ncbi:hypothetical protein ACE1OC_37125 [Streptomyces sp. DSM 116496]|uniref:hypothetical protein n=1 Tax=Streptomyces stoeckheimensis TaxID=3344656 RepID=UPI0038B2FA91
MPDCPHHKPATERLRRVLEDIGSSTTIATRVITDQAEAERRIGFIGSPTILIDGRDPFPEPGRGAGPEAHIPAVNGSMLCAAPVDRPFRAER